MDQPESTRLDTWLWAARFYKSRALAGLAVSGGRVELNGAKTKRAKPVRAGDRIRLGAFEHRLTVTAVALRRGPAAAAAALFQEDPDGKAARERLAEQHRLAARLSARDGGIKGRPTKRDRREIEKWKHREQ
jgi:ribosome-associated heat shock protein Hsp15